MKFIRIIAKLLVIIGALNWGLVGLFHYDVIADMFGAMSMTATTIYVLIGLSGLFKLVCFCRRCCGGGGGCGKCGCSNCRCGSSCRKD